MKRILVYDTEGAGLPDSKAPSTAPHGAMADVLACRGVYFNIIDMKEAA